MAYEVNPFQNLELEIPEVYRRAVEQFCQTQPGGGAKPSPDDSPFERYIDMWFVAVCLGAKRGKPPKAPKTKTHKFQTGVILSGDPYRIEFLELLAISHFNDPFILENPSKIVDMANEFAAVGLPELVEMLNSGNGKPIWNLTDSLSERLTDNPATS
jgi:hypothetical protein